MQKMMGLMRKCIDDYHMISPSDKIAVGVSGGKDSLTLLTVLAALRSYYPAPFELTAITIDMGLGGMDFSPVEALCRSLDVVFYCKKTEIGPIFFDYRKDTCVSQRKSYGGPAPEQSAMQIAAIEGFLAAHTK